MKTFEQEIRKRLIRIVSFLVFSGVAIILALVIKRYGNGGTDSGLSMEILIGGTMGIVITSVYRIQKYRRALHSRETLERLHIQETDERNRSIVLKACSSSLHIAFALLGVAGIVAVLFSRTVFLTIGAILISLLVLYGFLVRYYSRKY